MASSGPPPPGAIGDTKKAKARSRAVDRQMEEAAKVDEEHIKMLLLGAGESGKSTIFRQFDILYGEGFSEAQRAHHRQFIWANVVETVQGLKHACEVLGVLERVQAKHAFALCDALGPPTSLTSAQLNPEVGAAIAALWSEPVVRELVWGSRARFQLMDMASRFLDRVTEIARNDYTPTVEDVLHSRVRTTGIVEKMYTIEDAKFIVIDVGGQRNERRKWIHCFDEVDAIIFVVALSEYDQLLFEDETTNRMVEALELFESTINNHLFQAIDVIMFFNKSDLFQAKVAGVPIPSVPHFSDYSGSPNSYEEGVEYFTQKFLSLNRVTGKVVHHHVTNATDTSNVQYVMDATREIVLRGNFERAGFAPARAAAADGDASFY